MNKPATIKAIRGMNDLFPEQTSIWLKIEEIFKNTLEKYGYGQLRTPILESTNLFSRSIGDVTDIVEKEMYSFLDRNEKSLTLRPEGTASCVRAGIEHGKLYHQTQKWWYNGPMFRYERPQKGDTDSSINSAWKHLDSKVLYRYRTNTNNARFLEKVKNR